MIWTALVLVCSTINPSECLAAGGPAFKTQQECMDDFTNNGIMFLLRTYPDSTIRGARCVEWGPEVSA